MALSSSDTNEIEPIIFPRLSIINIFIIIIIINYVILYIKVRNGC